MHVGSNVLTEKKSGTVSVMDNGSAAAKGPVLQELCGSGAFIGRRAAAAGSRGPGACPGILAGSRHAGGGEDRFPSGAKTADGSVVLQVPDHPVTVAPDIGEGRRLLMQRPGGARLKAGGAMGIQQLPEEGDVVRSAAGAALRIRILLHLLVCNGSCCTHGLNFHSPFRPITCVHTH